MVTVVALSLRAVVRTIAINALSRVSGYAGHGVNRCEGKAAHSINKGRSRSTPLSVACDLTAQINNLAWRRATQYLPRSLCPSQSRGTCQNDWAESAMTIISRRMLLCRYSVLNTPASKHDYGRDCWVYNYILLYMKTYRSRQYIATLLQTRANTYACTNTHGLHRQAHYKRMHGERTFGYVAVIEAYCANNIAKCDSTFNFFITSPYNNNNEILNCAAIKPLKRS